MHELLGLGVAELGAKLRAREFSARELTDVCLAAAEAAKPLNAFTDVSAEYAQQMADAADQRLAQGDASPLLGIPVAVKDLFCTKGVRSQASSRILEDFRPPYESTVTEKLWVAGAVLLGKTNMDEFAMGSSTENSADGPTLSPWRRADDSAPLSPGGSSGGSAAAVAARVAPVALGTDTGGSIRQPAALTGTVGLKPTYGRCSRWGIVAFASSLDQAGPITRSVTDAALTLSAIAGHDAKDSTSADQPVPQFADTLSASIKGWKVGIPAEYRIDGISEQVLDMWDQAAEWLRDAGAEIVDISLPHTKYALPAYYVIAPAEASSNLARYDGVRYGRRAELTSGDDVHTMYRKTRAEGFGAEVRRRVLIGTYALSHGYYEAYYLRAQQVRALVRRDFDQCFADGVQAILTPTTPAPAFALGEKVGDPISMYLNDVFTVTANLAGLPGISIPAGQSADGLPLGMQLIGPPWREAEILTLAHHLESAAGVQELPADWWSAAS